MDVDPSLAYDNKKGGELSDNFGEWTSDTVVPHVHPFFAHVVPVVQHVVPYSACAARPSRSCSPQLNPSLGPGQLFNTITTEIVKSDTS